MKVRIFADTDSNRLEGEVNAWLAALPDGVMVTNTQTAATHATNGQPGAAHRPVCVISIWYSDI